MLIANCIIYYNGIILSKIYQQQEKLGNTKVLEFIKRLSPIAWCHVILDGCYRFRDKNSEINLDKIIETLIFDIGKNVKSTVVA